MCRRSNAHHADFDGLCTYHAQFFATDARTVVLVATFTKADKVNFLTTEKKSLALALILSLIPICLSLFRSKDPENKTSQKQPVAMDTHIPKGFVLVPIEIVNFEAVDSILGPYGLVDLYAGKTDSNSSPRLVLKDARLLRAPHNPSHFAVLIRENETTPLLSHGHEFTVIVKRPSDKSTELVRSGPTRKIIYGGPK